MAKRFRFPNYPRVPHKSGQARIKIRGRTYYLGKHGSAESHHEYNRLRQETLEAMPPAVPKNPKVECTPINSPVPRHGLFLVELFHRYISAMEIEHGADWYELRHHRRIALVVDRVLPGMKVPKFGTLDLARVQDAMLTGSWMNDAERVDLAKRGKEPNWARSWVNHQVTRIRTVFRWGESHGVVPPGTWEHLRTLRGVARTDRRARNTDPRRPVEWEDVDAVLDWLSPALVGVVLTQWWSGARPSEILEMTVGEMKDTANGFEYRPVDHKTAYRGAERFVAFGPRASEVIRPWFLRAKKKGDDATVFCLPAGRRPPGKGGAKKGYSLTAYDRAVKRACERAGVTPWTPYQLRHSAKRRVTREMGLDAARASLGQSSLGATNLYASAQDEVLAREAAKRCG